MNSLTRKAGPYMQTAFAGCGGFFLCNLDVLVYKADAGLPQVIVDLARCCTSLCSLDLGDNPSLSTDGLIPVIDGVMCTRMLKLSVLRLDRCGLDERTGPVLGDAAASSLPQLQEHPGIGDETVGVVLASFPSLHTLGLAFTGITVNSLTAIAAASHSRAFRHLDLSRISKWDDEEWFPVFLQGSWPQLGQLELSFCDIEDLELLAACQFPALQELDLGGNIEVTADSVLELQGRFPRLRRMVLWGTCVSVSECSSVLAAAFPAVTFST